MCILISDFNYVFQEIFIEENVNCEKIRNNAKEKVEKNYNRVQTKYHKILNQYQKSNKVVKTNHSNETSKQIDLTNKVMKYEAKLKKMTDVIQIANDNKEK